MNRWFSYRTADLTGRGMLALAGIAPPDGFIGRDMPLGDMPARALVVAQALAWRRQHSGPLLLRSWAKRDGAGPAGTALRCAGDKVIDLRGVPQAINSFVIKIRNFFSWMSFTSSERPRR